MRIIKSIGFVALVLILLVAFASVSNHTTAFWQLLREEESPYLFFSEDFSEVAWTESEYGTTGTSEYISQSDVRVIPWGAAFSTEGEYLTLYLDEAQSEKYPCVKIPFDTLNASENFAFDKLSYFVVKFDLWTETTAPRMVYMRNFIFDEYGNKTFASSDYCNLSYASSRYKNSRTEYSTYTFANQQISMATSRANRDTICAVVTVDPNDISKSMITYYLNGIENELSYSDWITSESEYISHFEFSIAKPYGACSLSIDNFKVYAFGKDFEGDMKNVLREVNYR